MWVKGGCPGSRQKCGVSAGGCKSWSNITPTIRNEKPQRLVYSFISPVCTGQVSHPGIVSPTSINLTTAIPERQGQNPIFQAIPNLIKFDSCDQPSYCTFNTIALTPDTRKHAYIQVGTPNIPKGKTKTQPKPIYNFLQLMALCLSKGWRYRS